MTVDELRTHLNNFEGSLPVFVASPNVLCNIVDIQSTAGGLECPVLIGEPAKFQASYSQWCGLRGTKSHE